MQRLGQHDAVEDCLWQNVRPAEIADKGRMRIARIDMEYIASPYPGTPEAQGVGIVADFEDSPMNVVGVLGQEPLDEVAIYRRTAMQAPAAAERRSLQIAEAHGAEREPFRPSEEARDLPPDQHLPGPMPPRNRIKRRASLA
jgi:hypothetical protein